MSRHIDSKPIVLRQRLEAAGARAHLEAVARSGHSVEIRTRSRAASDSQQTADQLGEVGGRLFAGELEAVQLRFVLDGMLWCDTLMRVGDSYRLVRMQQGIEATSPEKGDENCQSQRRA